MQLTQPYVCPRSRAPLAREGDLLVGPTGERYLIERGVPRFLASPPSEDPATALRLEHMLARAEAAGWRVAIDETKGDIAYVTAEARWRYVNLLPITPTSRVLEVGCSLGQGTAALARKAGAVDAVEVVPGQAAFAAERMRQEGLTNVSVCAAGDDCLLPFPSGRFDVAVLNLVLEWCGQRGKTTPEQSQRRLLGEVARTLRPGGVLFVATKNRFGAQYLTGSPDEHAGNLRFGNALPRPLLRAILKRRVRRADEPRGVLHSWSELQAMLFEAGFQDLRSYWAAPDARWPTAYIPTDTDAVRAGRAALDAAQLGTCKRVRAIMRAVPAPLVKHVAPSLVFTGVRIGRAA
jgi:SAM-dependent methyltransferase